MPKFSDRFKQLRTERRLSQQNLADQLGFSKSSVNMYERGEREPGLESMETIADYFNADLDYLMGRSDIPNRNDWLKSINKSVVVEPSQPQMKFDNIIPISTKRFPLLGDIACGKPIMANEEKELYVEAGAIVGAATAKQETKEVGGVPILYVDLSINGMNTTVSISNPPLKAADYLENAMNE